MLHPPSIRPPLARALALAERVSVAAVWAGGTLLLASVVLIGVDVVIRKLFNVTVGGADEISGYVFAISTSWALAWVVLQRGNVRVDFVYQHLGRRATALLDFVALVALAVFLAVLSRHAWGVAETSFVRNAAANTPLATPLWIPQGLWLLGLLWMCVVLALLLTATATALLRGDTESVHALAGVRSAREEAADEAEAGRRIVEGERA